MPGIAARLSNGAFPESFREVTFILPPSGDTIASYLQFRSSLRLSQTVVELSSVPYVSVEQLGTLITHAGGSTVARL